MIPQEALRKQYSSPTWGLDLRWDYQNLAVPPIREVHQRSLRSLRLVGNERVLDLGCGSGEQLVFLRDELGHKGPLVGVDLNSGMFAETARREPSIRFIETSADELPFADGSFDAATSLFMVYYMPDIQKALREWHRVLAQNGKLAIAMVQANHLLSNQGYRSLMDIPVTYLRFTLENGYREVEKVFAVDNVIAMPGIVETTDSEIVLRTFDSLEDMADPPRSERKRKAKRKRVQKDIEAEIKRSGSYKDNVSWVILECSKT